MSIHTDEERVPLQARKAARVASLRQDRRDSLTVAVIGLPMLGMGVSGLWFVINSLRKGYLDLDDGPDLLYAADDPVSFYVEIAFLAAFTLFCAVLGAQMVLHARREYRRAARRAERISRVGTRHR